MNENMLKNEQKIKHDDFLKISNYVENTYGIKLPEYKKYLVQSRLLKRLKALNIETYEEYIKYLFAPENKHEIQNMIDVVSTHKTDFFRENDHFEYITNTFLPNYTKNNDELNIWSVGCSTGEEVYTLAITIEEYLKKNNQQLNYKIYGSDVSVSSLETAYKAIYNTSKTEIIPKKIKQKYFLKNKDPNKNLLKITPELHEKTNFFQLNLLSESYKINKSFDLVMFRNTLIYFSRKNQEKILRKVINYLNKNGLLLIGHSESIFSMNLPVELLKTTIFKKK